MYDSAALLLLALIPSLQYTAGEVPSASEGSPRI